MVQGRECMSKVWLEDKAGTCRSERPKQFTVKAISEEAEWSPRRCVTCGGLHPGHELHPHNGPASEAEQAQGLGNLMTNLRHAGR